MEGSELLVDRREDDVLVLTLNRPKARNALSFAVWEQLASALDAAEVEPPRALILHGADGYFSAGGDIKNPPARGNGALSLGARVELAQRVIARIRSLPAPSIAAVEGGAIGMGWSLALACDMIFASETARFSLPFVELGIVPDGGAAWFLVQRLGRQKASEIIYSARAVGGEEAGALGLISRLVPAGQALDEALGFAQSIGKGNRHAVELTKRMLHRAESDDLAASHALELAYCHISQSGDEAKRAREAFLARSAASKQ